MQKLRPTLLPLLAGPLIWAVHFVFIYSANGIFCARPAWQGWWVDEAGAAWVILAAALAAIAALLLVCNRQRGRWPRSADPGFFAWVANALGLLSAVAILWQSLPVLWVPACAAA
ncbi:hypothetical protein [Bordetella petrii]|uniref:hypothetical protein n=1 Tax=Bordetella petrii TaxID=94624 RepID=UPI001E50E7CD|nr:hypothetical protein [Bordetella petrii]MCD0503603.1 hypothetical protein [Bordetella petrii]